MKPQNQIESQPVGLTKNNIILVACLAISLIASFNFYRLLLNSELEKDHKLNEKISHDLELAIEQNLHPLQGIASTLHYSDLKISSQSFRRAAESRNLFKNFPSAIGFGFIAKVAEKDLDKFVLNNKKERPNFNVHRFPNSNITNKNDDLFIIQIVEPLEANAEAIGLVISDEIKRRRAAVQAMDSGEPTITNSIQLVQAAPNERGFLYYLPVYKNQSKPKSITEKRNQLIGWAYSPILMTKVIDFILKQNPNTIPFQVSEVDENQQEKILYRHPDFDLPTRIDLDVYTSLRKIAGQSWMIKTISTSSHLSDIIIKFLMLFLILIGGSFLLYYYMESIDKERHFQQKLLNESQKAVQKATQELAEQKNFLRSVVDELPVIVGYWDKNLNNRLANKSYEKVFGKTTEEIYGKHISELLPESIYKNSIPYMLAALEGRTQEFENVVQKGPTKETIIIKYTPVIINDTVEGFTVVAVDISKIRKLEEENKEKQALLFSKSKLSLLGEMAGGIAHEINNPLAILRGKTEVVESLVAKIQIDSLDKNKILVNLDAVKKTIDRIASIIKGLRAFARDSDNEPFKAIDVRFLFSETIALSMEKLKAHSINLQIDNHEGSVLVHCNQTQIEQVLMNLISNSVDAISDMPSKWIRFIISKVDEYIEIRIIDSGFGIDAETEKKLMTPFFTTKEVGRGTGLGLSISKGIIENHKGTLHYELYSGHTSFVIKIPIYKKQD